MEREWRVISWAHNYEVSNYGEVRRVDTKRYLRGSKTTYGNLNISIPDDNGNERKRTIASIVAEMFIEKPVAIKGNIMVMHKDRNKLNNRVDNLKWIGKSDFNRKYVTRGQTFGMTYNRTKIKCVETDIVYDNMAEAARLMGIDRSGINRCANDPNRTYKGFHFVRVS